jgi:CheY-like chemotaxis protein
LLVAYAIRTGSFARRTFVNCPQEIHSSTPKELIKWISISDSGCCKSGAGLRSALQAGSCFAIDLPLGDARPLAPLLPEPVASAPLNGLRCLVVDDDQAILDASRTLLEQWGCRVDCVTSGAEARTRLGDGATRYDVLLCDLQLADDEDGMEVIEAARRLQPQALAVPVSGATSPEVLQRLRQSEALLLTKPVAPAKLRALLSARRR